jgi:2-iminobutanoate/2-iminopropanoate deaminase
MIRRLSPDIGYLAPSAMDRSGASQLVIAAGQVHWSGIVAARSTAEGMEIVADDMRGQLEYILGILDRCLAEGGSDRTRIVTVTMFATDLPALGASLDVFRDWVGEHRPTLTTIGVARLARPQLLLEVQGAALLV